MRNQDEVGDLDFQWIREYGTAYRIKGCYSVCRIAYQSYLTSLTEYLPRRTWSCWLIQKHFSISSTPPHIPSPKEPMLSRASNWWWAEELLQRQVFNPSELAGSHNWHNLVCRWCTSASKENHEPGILNGSDALLFANFQAIRFACKQIWPIPIFLVVMFLMV